MRNGVSSSRRASVSDSIANFVAEYGLPPADEMMPATELI